MNLTHFVLLYCIIVFVAMILIPTIFLIQQPIYKKHCEATGDIINYNGLATKYVYRSELTRTQILDRLKMPNINDGIRYSLKEDEITFSQYGDMDSTWQIIVEEYHGFSILRVNKLGSVLISQRYLSMKMNPFWVNKCDAKPIPFSDYGI